MSGMEGRWRAMGASLLFMIATGCAGMTGVQPQPAEFVDPVLGLLSKGIVQLDINIDRTVKRLDELNQFPDTQDTVLQELRALDQLGLDLHQQQWVLQRNHLHFAKAQLLASKQNPADKARLLQEWTTHEQQYRQGMDAFRQKRLDLEHTRLTIEAQLIARSLQ